MYRVEHEQGSLQYRQYCRSDGGRSVFRYFPRRAKARSGSEITQKPCIHRPRPHPSVICIKTAVASQLYFIYKADRGSLLLYQVTGLTATV